MRELISIIVPVYNVEKYLARCLESILEQTYKDLEVILVDDGSTDASPRICDQYAEKDKRIRVVHKKNGGLSDARNYGMRIMRGNYVVFIDSDDLVHKQAVELLYQNIKKYNADICYAEHVRFSKMSEISEEEYKHVKVDVLTGREMERRAISTRSEREVIAPNKLYKKEIFDGITFPVGKYHEDMYTTYKVIYNAKKSVYINANLYYYFMNSESITHNFSLQKVKDSIDASAEQIAFFKKEKDIEFFLKAQRIFLVSVIWQYYKMRNEEKKCKLQYISFIQEKKLYLTKPLYKLLFSIFKSFPDVVSFGISLLRRIKTGCISEKKSY